MFSALVVAVLTVSSPTGSTPVQATLTTSSVQVSVKLPPLPVPLPPRLGACINCW